MSKDLYEILGVARDASDAEIKAAYRKLAMRLHPDRNPGDEEAETQFKEVNAAYEALKDPKKRAIYDQYGHAGLGQGGPGGFPGDGAGFGGAGFGDIFEEFFGDIFGGGGGPGGPRGGRGGRGGAARGEDFRYDISISLESVAEGSEEKLRIPSIISCESCGGSGAKPGSGPETCAHCHGSGQVRSQQGFFSISRPCPSCSGRGQIIRDPCPECHGQGRKRSQKSLTVKIPPGIETGNRIRLTGEGGAGLHGGPAGDLYIVVEVKEHPIFDRDGPDLLCQVPITFPQAALGGKIEVPTLSGRARITLPAGTQTGKRFVLRGKGLPHLNRPGVNGNLVVEVRVETPVRLNGRQKELMEELAGTLENESQPDSTSFFDRVKVFLDKMST
ncbi:MAG: molecular chaperone DnaJ [Magnetococcales bacterium]|nr:molecular chaperone DnaJ [Magnetococcales bacterium]